MSIQVTVAPTVPHDAYTRIEALTLLLRDTDANFAAVPIVVARGDPDGKVAVADPEDYMRGQLLRHLLEEALKDASDSIMGELRAQ